MRNVAQGPGMIPGEREQVRQWKRRMSVTKLANAWWVWKENGKSKLKKNIYEWHSLCFRSFPIFYFILKLVCVYWSSHGNWSAVLCPESSQLMKLTDWDYYSGSAGWAGRSFWSRSPPNVHCVSSLGSTVLSVFKLLVCVLKGAFWKPRVWYLCPVLCLIFAPQLGTITVLW